MHKKLFNFLRKRRAKRLAQAQPFVPKKNTISPRAVPPPKLLEKILGKSVVNKPLTPKPAIVKKPEPIRWTPGGEFITIRGDEYVGHYHIMPNGVIMQGKSHGTLSARGRHNIMLFRMTNADIISGKIKGTYSNINGRITRRDFGKFQDGGMLDEEEFADGGMIHDDEMYADGGMLDEEEMYEEGGMLDDEDEMYEDGGLMEEEEFADGGMVYGNSHAAGGVKFNVGGRVVELEGGEAVINKKSTSMYRNELSAINEAGGGVNFSTDSYCGGGMINEYEDGGMLDDEDEMYEDGGLMEEDEMYEDGGLMEEDEMYADGGLMEEDEMYADGGLMEEDEMYADGGMLDDEMLDDEEYAYGGMLDDEDEMYEDGGMLDDEDEMYAYGGLMEEDEMYEDGGMLDDEDEMYEDGGMLDDEDEMYEDGGMLDDEDEEY